MQSVFARLLLSPQTVSIGDCTEFEANSAGLWAKALPDGRCVIGADCQRVLRRHYQLTMELAHK